MSYHAKLSPSSAKWWSNCTAGPSHCAGLTDDGNAASRMGTADHAVSAECLEYGLEPSAFLGREFWFCAGRREDFADRLAGWEPEHVVIIDEEHVDAIERYVNFVRERHATVGGTLLIEQAVPIAHITGEYKAPGKPATGTSDVILMHGDTIEIIDAKFGHDRVWAYDVVVPDRMNPITGEAEPAVIKPNDQMAMYAGGAYEVHRLFNDFKQVRMTIVQPRCHHISEHSMSVDALLAHLDKLRIAADETRNNPVYRPSAEACKWCKGRAACSARDTMVMSTALDGFEDACTAQPKHVPDDQLGIIYEKLDLIEAWISDKRLRAYEYLVAGKPLIRSDGLRYKLVLGKSPARKWTDEAAVAAILGEHAYKEPLVITVAEAERLSTNKKNRPAIVGNAAWQSLQHFIFQGTAKPVIALETDPREAVQTTDFEEISSDSNF